MVDPIGFETERLFLRQWEPTDWASFAAVGNRRFRAVMERLTMRESGTFEHPHVPEGSPLRLHCLYRLPRDCYEA